MLVRSAPEVPELQKSPVSTSVHFRGSHCSLHVFSEVAKDMSRTVVHIFHLLLYLNLYDVTGGLAAGAMAGIIVVAVVFALLPLMIIAVIIWRKRSHVENKKSTNILHENNCTSVGDLQADCHQAERSQSYAQPLDAITPKDSTHSDNQSNTVLQASDRRRFLKREVCTSLQGTVPLYLSTLLLTRRSQELEFIYCNIEIVFSFAIVFTLLCYLFSFFSSTLTSIRILLLMKRLKQTCPMRHV